MQESSKKSILCIFLDGVGIGPRDPSRNPFARFTPTILEVFEDHIENLPRDGLVIPTDASLGVPGIPQSATGQTTLFTGTNAAKLIGTHQQGFPGKTLKELIARESIFRRLRDAGLDPAFANVYTPRFFARRPRWVSVTTVMAETAGVRLRTLDDLHQERGLFMDFTNQYLLDQNLSVPHRTPEEAGALLARLAPHHHLCLYEFFLTDLAGHRGSMEEAEAMARRVDRFLTGVITSVDLENCSVLVTSDHGNLEDKSRKPHTHNPVPTLVWGELQREFAGTTRSTLSLDQISPAMLRFLTKQLNQ